MLVFNIWLFTFHYLSEGAHRRVEWQVKRTQHRTRICDARAVSHPFAQAMLLWREKIERMCLMSQGSFHCFLVLLCVISPLSLLPTCRPRSFYTLSRFNFDRVLKHCIAQKNWSTCCNYIYLISSLRHLNIVSNNARIKHFTARCRVVCYV